MVVGSGVFVFDMSEIEFNMTPSGLRWAGSVDEILTVLKF
jgi:hypothetical protein